MGFCGWYTYTFIIGLNKKGTLYELKDALFERFYFYVVALKCQTPGALSIIKIVG